MWYMLLLRLSLLWELLRRRGAGRVHVRRGSKGWLLGDLL